MDQTQNDSFGSLSNDQGGNMQTGGGISGGGIPGSISSGGVPGGQNYTMPMGSGVTSGPVVLNNGGGRRSKKWAVVLVVFLVFVAVAGGVFAVWKSGVYESGANNDDLVYEYINLLMLGKDSREKYDGEINVAFLTNDENEDEGVQNIYTFLKIFAYNSEDSISYYKRLKEVLDRIKETKDSRDSWGMVVFLVNNSKELLSRYFVSAILSETNAGYSYFVRNKSFDGFLSEYDNPFVKSDEVFLQDTDVLIDGLFDVKEKIYKNVSETNCMKSDGIDYECLESLSSEEIRLVQMENLEMSTIVRDTVNDLLDLIIANAGSMVELIGGGYNE